MEIPPGFDLEMQRKTKVDQHTSPSRIIRLLVVRSHGRFSCEAFLRSSLLSRCTGERILQKASAILSIRIVVPVMSCMTGVVSFLPGRGDKACFSLCPFSDHDHLLLLTV